MATVLPAFNPTAGIPQAVQFAAQAFQQNKLRQQQQQLGIADQQALAQFMQQQLSGGGIQQDGQLPPIPQNILANQLPTMQTLGGAGALTNFLAQQPTPQQQQLDQARLGLIQAQTGAAGTVDPIKGVAQSPGTQIVNPVTGEIISEATPFKQPEKKQSESVITDPLDPSKAIRVRNVFDDNGNLVNQTKVGEATLAEKIGGVASEALQGSTKGKLEKDIIDLSQTLTELGSIEGRMNPDSFGGDFTFEDFFTFRGKGKSFITDLALQLDVPPGEAAQKFLSAKTTFSADAKRVFLKFRKFITGVAGGIKEFQEIAKASIDPEKGSAVSFRAKFDSMKDSAIRTQNMLLAMRNSGLDPNSPSDRKKAFKGRSLSDIPLEVDPSITLEGLGQAVNNKANITESLRQGLDEFGLPGGNQQFRTPQQETRLQELLRKASQ